MIEFAVESITPYQASVWLKQSVGNRALKTSKLKTFVDDMLDGSWVITGEAIKFNTQGQLVDGHHRLEACVLAGKVFRSAVVRGVENEVHAVLDTGTSRSLADELKFQGYASTSNLAALLTKVWKMDRRLYNTGVVANRREMLELVGNNPVYVDAIRATHRDDVLWSANVGAAWAIVARDISLREANAWLEAMTTKIGLFEGHVGLALQNVARNERTRTGTFDPIHRQALVNKSFIAWAQGKNLKQLVWRRGGSASESFPYLVADEFRDNLYFEGGV